MVKSFLKSFVWFALASMSSPMLIGALVDTDGNAATNQTLLGDIDMGVGTLGDLKSYVEPSKIADGTNTIDAAGNFNRIIYRNAWIGNDGNVFTNVIGTYRWISTIKLEDIYPGLEIYKGYVEWDPDAFSIYGESGEGWWYNGTDSTTMPEMTYAGGATLVTLPNLTRKDHVLSSKLALTNDIPTVDYTTSNTQLVATIEATAPAPGNYSAVSNAAMTARSATDLGVRGAPQGDGSWFMVNGRRFTYHNELWKNGADLIYHYDGQSVYDYIDTNGIEFSFVLGDDFMSVETRGTNNYIIVGYTNTLAQVSQIPSVPSLSGLQPFDFSDMRGVYLSLSNIIHALGGSVTNFPTFNQ